MTMVRHLGALWLLVALATVAGCAGTPVGPVSEPPRAGELKIVANGEPVIGFALGGGAARGFAHVGVLNVLDRHGIQADAVAGTSAGSFAGALYAGGLQGQRLVEEAMRLERRSLTDYIFPARGFIRGESLQRYVNKAVGHRRLQDLPIPFAAVATDLYSGDPVVFNRGNTGMAVRASSSMPGVVQPVRIRGRDYVDGGLVSQVPVKTARAMGADVVIAVDVSQQRSSAGEINSTLDVLGQALVIMMTTMVEQELRNADVVIRPQVGDIALGNFEMRADAIAAGERAAAEKLPAVRAAIARAASARQDGPPRLDDRRAGGRVDRRAAAQ